MDNLKTDNILIRQKYQTIIQKIIREITNRNVSVVNLCEKIYLTPSEFIDSLENIKSSYKYYCEVLEVVSNM